jgi:type IV pilus assembly protein PilX
MPLTFRPRPAQQGFSLIVVMILLVVVTVLGIAGARIALLGERSTRYDRDYQIAWEAAEAALIDAEYDIGGQTFVNNSPNQRTAVFDGNSIHAFVVGCGTGTGTNQGLCVPSTTAVPVWQATGFDFVTENSSSPFVKFGDKTGRQYQSGSGIQPAHLPHYIIEYANNQAVGGNAAGGQAVGGSSTTGPKYIYRITAIGFGPNEQTQVMMQSSFYKP